MDDITFCLSDCQRTDCFRHPSNIQDRTIPHSYADFKGTETCPFAKGINVPINDDTISRKTVIDAVHTATYEFICGAEDGDEMTDADKLVLSINKAVCNAIKALPTAPNTSSALSALDCVDRQAAVDAIRAKDDYSNVAVALGLGKAITAICELPSVQPVVKDINVPVNDCISRQAAIDGILEFMPQEPKNDATSAEHVNYSAWCCALNCAEAFVRTMPSVQPDWNEMIVICDCCGHAIHVKRQW